MDGSEHAYTDRPFGPLTSLSETCPACGEALGADDVFCANCGEVLPTRSEPDDVARAAARSQSAAQLIAVLAGTAAAVALLVGALFWLVWPWLRRGG